MGKQKASMLDSSLNGERFPPLFESLYARQCIVPRVPDWVMPRVRMVSLGELYKQQGK